MKYSKKKGIVYLLGDSSNEGVYKIGVTRRKIEDRIKSLQTGNSGEIYLVDFYETNTPFFLENSLHRRYFSDKESGEWYKIPLNEAENFRNRCKEIEDIVDALKNNPFFPKNLK